MSELIEKSSREKAASPNVVNQHCSSGRWWLAVGVGFVVSLPLAWLLSHAAQLPFFIGIFFFALFGLVVGAVMHRIASRGRPFGRNAVIVGTSIVVGVVWGLSIVQESRDFPMKQATNASRSRRIVLEGRTVKQYRADVASTIRTVIESNHPPGGAFGYISWVVSSGEFKKGEIEGVTKTLRAPQRGVIWIIRAMFSLAMLGFGIGSQTLPLRLAKEHSPRSIRELCSD